MTTFFLCSALSRASLCAKGPQFFLSFENSHSTQRKWNQKEFLLWRIYIHSIFLLQYEMCASGCFVMLLKRIKKEWKIELKKLHQDTEVSTPCTLNCITTLFNSKRSIKMLKFASWKAKSTHISYNKMFSFMYNPSWIFHS